LAELELGYLEEKKNSIKSINKKGKGGTVASRYYSNRQNEAKKEKKFSHSI
jgi:hypothetical protein